MTSILDYSQPEVAAELIASGSIDAMQSSFNSIVTMYKFQFDRVWRPAAGATYTTAGVLAAYGTFAADVFTKSGQTRDFIELMQPGALPDNYKTPPVAVTVHSDGTVTLT